MCKQNSNNEFMNYYEAGFRLIRLHDIDENGHCTCEDGEACEMAGKHPFHIGWQHTETMDAEQLETMMEFGWLNQYGILIDKHLVIDIDPRNGGDESFKVLCRDLNMDLMAESGHYVKTGGGGYHIFYKIPENHPLLTKLPKYPGIDFKTNGFVVGAGSRHKSGNIYEVIEGYPQDAEEAPAELLTLLKRNSNYHRVTINNEPVTIDEDELVKMLEFIPTDDYEIMITVGMGLHHATNGIGLDLWDDWCKKSDKYDGYNIKQKKWHSFGKNPNPRTIGSVYHLAEEHGYIQPVTFEAGDAIRQMMAEEETVTQPTRERVNKVEVVTTKPNTPINYKAIDRLKPPGLVGEISQYINEQNLRPREWLSVMAALSIVGNCGGLRYKDDISGVTANAFFMGVADSGTSKNKVLEICTDAYRHVGIDDAVSGRVKSEQELIRNLMHNQGNFYLIDEFGKFLSKITKSGAGSAHYLEGITGVLMDAYSKAEGYFLLSGDQKEGYKKDLASVYNQINKRLKNDEYESPMLKSIDIQNAERWKDLMRDARSGIKKPFVSICAFTTSLGFNDFFSKETVLDGFLGRCILFQETDSAPGMNKLQEKREMDQSITNQLMQIYYGGTYDSMGDGRVEYYGEREKIPTTEEAKKLMVRVSNFFNELAIYYRDTNGFEALALRGYEAVAKISLILAIPSKQRTIDHVEYAFTVVMHDLEAKINLVTSNETKDAKTNDELVEYFKSIVLAKLSSDGMPKSVLVRTLTAGKKKMKKEDVEPFLDAMVKNGFIQKVEVKGKGVKFKKL